MEHDKKQNKKMGGGGELERRVGQWPIHILKRSIYIQYDSFIYRSMPWAANAAV